MYIGSRDMRVILEHYSDREFAIIGDFIDNNKVQHFDLEFCDKKTDYYGVLITIHLRYESAIKIVVDED